MERKRHLKVTIEKGYHKVNFFTMEEKRRLVITIEKGGKITIYAQMEGKFQFGIGCPLPNDNIQVWNWISISK